MSNIREQIIETMRDADHRGHDPVRAARKTHPGITEKVLTECLEVVNSQKPLTAHQAALVASKEKLLRDVGEAVPTQTVALDSQEVERRWEGGLQGYRSFGELAEAQLGAWERVESDASVRSKVMVFWQRLARSVLDGQFDDENRHVVVDRSDKRLVVTSDWFQRSVPSHMSDQDEAALGELLYDARTRPEAMKGWAQRFGYKVPDDWFIPDDPPQIAFAKTLMTQNPRPDGEQKELWKQRLIQIAKADGLTISKRAIEYAMASLKPARPK